MQVAWGAFDAQLRPMVDPALRGMLLRDNDNAPGAPLCLESGKVPFYAFGNASAAEYWVSTVVAEVAAESSDVAAVFFDETDWNACGYSFVHAGCANITDTFLAADLQARCNPKGNNNNNKKDVKNGSKEIRVKKKEGKK
jgi:hypothetical protein